MTTSTQEFSWRFGGWLSEQSTTTAWTLLGAGALLGVAFTFWSYRSALAAVESRRRYFLCGLRATVWLTLLLILAAPTRVERTFENNPMRPLAVLVDRSASMTTPDNRQRRRLDDALLRWRTLEPAGRKNLGPPKYFAFADGFQGIATADTAATLPAMQTAFFSSLQRVLAEAPAGGWGGIVTLTDGLDTTGVLPSDGVENTSQMALAANTPLFFVPGRNHYAGGDFFSLREFTAPAQTPPHSTFRVEATFDGNHATARVIEVQFKIDGVARPVAPLKIEAGRRLATWSTEITAEKPGVIELEFRADLERARISVRVEPPPSNRILYFQGALDWGYRFLADIMKRDSAFVLTPVFNFPNPKALLPAGALEKMPTTSAELAGFDIVILANAAAAQFSAAQQTALSNWVRDGGILLFLTPDDDSTQGFAGSELEKMLPVVFLPPQAVPSRQTSLDVLAQFRARTGVGGGSADTPLLTPYKWEETPRVREIFADAAKQGGAVGTPVFSAFAHVARAKPGAEVLARHPDETAADGGHAILLALQRYGRGQSAVLTTDALWRWKLNQPSTDRGAELFWQNLFTWMSRDRQRGLRFDHAPLHVQTGQDVTLRLEADDGKKITVVAIRNPETQKINSNGKPTAEPLTEGQPAGAKRVFQWKPTIEGFWQITATDANGREARHWLSVDKSTVTGELSGMAPDETLMRTLASRTGGSILEKDPPATWLEVRSAAELLAERREPLWHRGWVFGMLLGLYSVELLLRRKWHLL